MGKKVNDHRMTCTVHVLLITLFVFSLTENNYGIEILFWVRHTRLSGVSGLITCFLYKWFD